MGRSRMVVVMAVTMVLAVGSVEHRPALAANGDCGQPISTGSAVTSTDALAILRVAVGLLTCLECICDINGNGSIAATDALAALRIAVGQTIALNCPSCTPTTTTTLGGGSQPALTSGDFPAVSPCSDRDTLPNDAAFLGVIANATGYDLMVNFTSFDTAGFTEICGLAAVDNSLGGGVLPWDPSKSNGVSVCSEFTDNVRDIFNNFQAGHGPELCRTGTDSSAVFSPAMPRAGTYRKDACIESGGNSYDLRTRVTVTGPSVDKTFAELGITRADVRACNGTVEIATASDARSFITASGANYAFYIKSGSCSGTEHLEVETEIICVHKRSSVCPPADFDCF